jgi:hypothetical protein
MPHFRRYSRKPAFLYLNSHLSLFAHKNGTALISRLELELAETCFHETFQIGSRFFGCQIFVESLFSDKFLRLKMQDALCQYRADPCLQKIIFLRLTAGSRLDQVFI